MPFEPRPQALLRQNSTRRRPHVALCEVPARPPLGLQITATRAVECPNCGLLQRLSKTCQNKKCKTEMHDVKSPLAGLRFHDLRNTANHEAGRVPSLRSDGHGDCWTRVAADVGALFAHPNGGQTSCLGQHLNTPSRRSPFNERSMLERVCTKMITKLRAFESRQG